MPGLDSTCDSGPCADLRSPTPIGRFSALASSEATAQRPSRMGIPHRPSHRRAQRESLDGAVAPRRSWLGDDPAATLKLRGQQFRRDVSQRSLGSGRAYRTRWRRWWALVVRRFFQLFEEGVGLVPGELSSGLALRESHWTAGITEVGVTGIVRQREQLANLVRRGG